jgi:hypothetical protein
MKKPPRNTVEEGQAKPDANALRAHKPVYFRSAGQFRQIRRFIAEIFSKVAMSFMAQHL